LIQEFKKFALRGNVIDLAVGIIIGAAFNSVVNSLVNDVIMPPIGLLTGRLDFKNLIVVIKQGDPAGPYLTPEAADAAGAVAIAYGQFFNSLLSFMIVAFAVFLLVRIINRMYVEQKDEGASAEPVNKDCPYCYREIPVEARRCPFCTSHLKGGPEDAKSPAV